MRFLWGFLSAILIAVVTLLIFGIYSIRAGALEEPAGYQDAATNRGKLWFVPEAPEVAAAKSEEAILDGAEHFNHHCAVCHDLSGDADSLFAESFHPPVADLTSKRVQAYSDGQLKWIIDSGIRYTGMPAWAKLMDDDNQWKIVYYIRILNQPDQAEKYKELLKQRGKWMVQPPGEEHEHEEAHVEQPGAKPQGTAAGEQAEESPQTPEASDHRHD